MRGTTLFLIHFPNKLRKSTVLTIRKVQGSSDDASCLHVPSHLLIRPAEDLSWVGGVVGEQRAMHPVIHVQDLERLDVGLVQCDKL